MNKRKQEIEKQNERNVWRWSEWDKRVNILYINNNEKEKKIKWTKKSKIIWSFDRKKILLSIDIILFILQYYVIYITNKIIRYVL